MSRGKKTQSDILNAARTGGLRKVFNKARRKWVKNEWAPEVSTGVGVKSTLKWFDFIETISYGLITKQLYERKGKELKAKKSLGWK